MSVVTTDEVAGRRIVRITGQCFGVAVRGGDFAVPMMCFDNAEIGNSIREIAADGIAATVAPAP